MAKNLNRFEPQILEGDSGNFNQSLSLKNQPVLTGIKAGQSMAVINNGDGTFTVASTVFQSGVGTAISITGSPYLDSGVFQGINGAAVFLSGSYIFVDTQYIYSTANGGSHIQTPNFVGTNGISVYSVGSNVYVSGQGVGFITLASGDARYYPISSNPSNFQTSGQVQDKLDASGNYLKSLIVASNAGVSSLNNLSGLINLVGQGAITVYTGQIDPSTYGIYISGQSGALYTGINAGNGSGLFSGQTGTSNISLIFKSLDGINLGSGQNIFTSISGNSSSLNYQFKRITGVGTVAVYSVGNSIFVSGMSNTYTGNSPIIVDNINNVISFNRFIAGDLVNSLSQASATGVQGDVSASNYVVTYDPWKAFDHDNSSAWMVPIADFTTGVPWIQYTFSTGKQITSYAIVSDANGPSQYGSPRTWSLSGSYDGSGWSLLDSRAGEIIDDPYNVVRKGYAITQNTGLFSYYRLCISDYTTTAFVPVADKVALFELEFYLNSDKYPLISELSLTSPSSGISIVKFKHLEGWKVYNFSGVGGIHLYQDGDLIYISGNVTGGGGSVISGMTTGTSLRVSGSDILGDVTLTGIGGVNISTSGNYILVSGAQGIANVTGINGVQSSISGNYVVLSLSPTASTNYQYLVLTGDYNLSTSSPKNIHTFCSGNSFNLNLPSGLSGQEFFIHNLTPALYNVNLQCNNILQVALHPRWNAHGLCRGNYWEWDVYPYNTSFIQSYYNLNFLSTGIYSGLSVPSGLRMVIHDINFLSESGSGITQAATISVGSVNNSTGVVYPMKLRPLINNQMNRVIPDLDSNVINAGDTLLFKVLNAASGVSGAYDYETVSILANYI